MSGLDVTDRDRRHDDRHRHYSDRPEGLKAGQFRRRRLDNIIASVEQPRAKRSYDAAYEKLLDGPCPIHKNSKHTMRECFGLAKAFRDEQNKKRDDPEGDGGTLGQRLPSEVAPSTSG